MQIKSRAISSFRAHDTTASDHRIEIERIGTGTKGDVYRVLHGATVLLDRTRLPLLDAARKLRESGLTGRLEMYRSHCLIPVLITDIEAASLLTVVENGSTPPKFARYQPLDGAAIALAAVSRGVAKA